MFIALSLFLLTSISILSAVFAKPAFSSDGLSEAFTADVTPRSQTLQAPEPNFAIHCVPPTKHRMWEGEINATDCKAALFAIDIEVSRFEARDFTFWSDRYEPYAPFHPWSLPYAKSSGSCYVLFRIARDFGDNVLPLSDRDYLVTSTRLETFRNRWIAVLLTLRALIDCIEVNGQPGWSSVSDDRGIVLLFPVSSGMKRAWAATNRVVGGMNGTGLDLVGVS